MPKITLFELADLEGELATKQEMFLRQQGWNYTCDHPGSLWLWVKDINGKSYRCGADTALAIEEGLGD